MPTINTAELSNIPEPRFIVQSRAQIRQNNSDKKVIVLDDDPTGCQTVHNIHVLMQWDLKTLKNAIENYGSFYLLHNSRSLTGEEALKLNEEICKSLLTILPKEKLVIVSRSDSTLRGHFLPELTALQKTTGPYDGILIIPYFKEGGRLTLHDEHYVVIDDKLIPASETEFAKDPIFGYTTSNLPKWIEEKTEGTTQAEEVISITIEDIRLGGIDRVMQKLSPCSTGQFIVVNALQDEDLDIVILALQQLEKNGKRFLHRSAASFVKVLLGLEDQPLWLPDKIGKRGVIIAGSHVNRTSIQLKSLLDTHKIYEQELSIRSILNSSTYFEECLQKLTHALQEEQTVLIYTEREYELEGSDDNRLKAGRKISDFLSNLINGIEIAPDFIIAKGGITANDVAKYGLEIVDARVLGQIQPGIPVWQPGPESKFPNCTYVVFPGNVGEDDTLTKVYEIMTRNR